MRKVNPADVRAAFKDDAAALMAFMNRVRRALEGESHPKQDVSHLASMVFLDLYVGFERFLSDLFLAYLNRDFSRYQADLENRIRQSTEAKFSPWAESRIHFSAVKHAKLDELETLIDPEGWNLTFKDADAILEKTDAWLAPVHRARVRRLSDHDKRLIDTARAVRDFIAHQSPGAKERMNHALASVSAGGHNAQLGRGVHKIDNVGAYLKAVFDGRRRVAIYADRLGQIAGQM